MQAGLLLFLGSVILLAFRSHRSLRRDRGAHWFAAAFFSSGIGLLLQSERDLIPAVYSILFGNGLFMLFGVFANRAIAETTRQRGHFYYLLALDLATVANFAYFTYWQPNLMLRVAEAVFVMGVMYGSIVVLLLRSREPVVQPAMRAMAGLFMAHTVAQFARITLAYRVHIPEAWYSWVGIVSIAGLALAYLWMDSLRMQAQLEQTAMTDPLTGLFNRRALEMVAVRELQRTARKHQPSSALMMDIDRFKDINDRLGHAAGDSTLCAVAGAVQACLRASDIATRLGGDEFFVMLPDTDEEAAGLVVARLRHSIEQLRLQTMGGEVFRVAMSIGQVTMRNPETTVDDLLHASDIVLYREKQVRRSQQTLASSQSEARAGGAQVQPSNA